jgi:hypothetical protein
LRWRRCRALDRAGTRPMLVDLLIAAVSKMNDATPAVLMSSR